MIVQMPTKAQASKVAELTGGTVLSDKNAKATTKVKVEDFESHRSVIEGISVLFKLFSDDDTEVPSGWMVTGAAFEVEWPKEQERQSLIWSHFGARRFAKNWAIEQVKADLDVKKKNPHHAQVPWTLGDLRKRWNQVKDEKAPWWAENQKECYSAGIADALQALWNWSDSKHGKRKGKQAGFPRFESKKRAKNRVRFGTGAMRLGPDRRHLTLPVIGTLRLKRKHPTSPAPMSQKGNAWVFSMTSSKRWGRLFMSIQYAVRTSIVSPSGRTPTKPDAQAGVDLDVCVLATIADTDGNIIEVPNPKPLRETLAERRRVGRQLSRRILGSQGHRRAKAKLARLDRRAVCVRREMIHQLTRNLVDTYGEVLIEDLDLDAMKRSMGRRAFRRSVGDAGLGAIRPTLSYKAERANLRLVVADRCFPSTKLHHGCDATLAGKKLAKALTCEICGKEVDRDDNAAKNISDLAKVQRQSWCSWRQCPVRTRTI